MRTLTNRIIGLVLVLAMLAGFVLVPTPMDLEAHAATDYYLFGWINGANYACEEDHANMGNYKFVNGKLNVRFDVDSYVGIKTTGNAEWYMTQFYTADTYGSFHNTNTGAGEKMLIPGGVSLTLSLTVNNDGTLSLSYAPTVEYYLFGWINGANYACEEDAANMGKYKFENGQLIVHFDQDSYVGVKTTDNANWYMAKSFVSDTTGMLYNTNTGANEKMFVPGGRDVLLTVIPHSDDSLTLMRSGDECVHSYTSKVTTKPTCTAEGVETFTCSKCGDSYRNILGATGHNYKSTVTTAATCTANGVKTFKCSTCNHSYTETIAATGHSFKNGKCSVCGKVDPNCDHNYKSTVTTAATCEKQGLMTYTCSKCGDVYTAAIPAAGHKYVDIVVPPTCDNNGYTQHKCSVCGNYGLNTDAVNPIGHNYSTVVTNPTCTEKGYTTYTCANCGHVYTWNETAATGHRFAGGVCTNCGLVDENYVEEFYLFGYINGADYGIGDDYHNLGQYKFVDGKVTVTFTEDSYVAVKTGDNALWYMTNGWLGEATSATLYKFTDPYAASANKLMVAGGQTVIFTLTKNWDDNLVLSYTVDPASCHHSSHDAEGICATCGAKVEHQFSHGVCGICGLLDPNYVPYQYYLYGFINGANYGCEEDYTNLGEYKFVDGKLTAIFTEDCYVGVKEVDPNSKFGPEVVAWYVTDGWLGADVTSATLHNSAYVGNADKFYVPGGAEISFTLVVNGDGTLTLSYEVGQCHHLYGAFVSSQPTCTNTGLRVYTCGYCGYSYTESIPALGHNYIGNICTLCGDNKNPTTTPDYYLFGYINGVDYGIGADMGNIGTYKFVNGKLTVTFTEDSYIGVKTGDNSIWYMTNGYVGEASSAVLYPFFDPIATSANKLLISGGQKVHFTLTENWDGNLLISYKVDSSTCKHTSHTTEGICEACDSAVPHSYVYGVCTVCGGQDPNYVSYDYYLFGYINGANYGCEEDADNVGHFQFRSGTRTATFTEDSYVGVKAVNPGTGEAAIWYMTDGWQGLDTTSVTLYDSTMLGNADKLYVPGGMKVTFTLVVNENGTLTLSYKASECPHTYDGGVTTVAPGCTTAGLKTYTCTLCNNYYTENLAPTGHSFSGGKCTVCGEIDAGTEYYLFGFINNANYGCEGDYENMGIYKFVDGKLTVRFDSASFVGIKTTGNADWYMTKAYTEETSATFYNVNEGSWEKMYIPGNAEVTMTLTVNDDGTLTLSYVAGECDHLYSSYVSVQPGCETTGVRVHTCGYCGHSYEESMAALGHHFESGFCTSCGTMDPNYVSPDYYLFGYINGADYGWKDDINNLGRYKFENGKLTVRFDDTSYVAVKSGDNKRFFMVNGYVGEVSSATLVEFSDPNSVAGNRLYVPGGVPVTFTLGVDHNGNLTLSYTLPPSACHHPQHNDEGICPTCGTPVGHYYENGVCNGCGATDPSYNPYEYYLFGFINGVNYGTEDDYANVGEYKFEDGKLTTTFTEDSYVGVKEADPNGKFGLHIMGWYMTDGWQGTDITSVTLYNSDQLANADKLYVPGGVQITFTLVRNEDGTLTLSYERGQCQHLYSSYVSVQPGCETTGVRVHTCGYCGHSYEESMAALGHNFVTGICTNCGTQDPSYVSPDYYLFGYINGADYGWKDDINNLGHYKFENGKLTVRFDEASYVAVKSGDNKRFFMVNGYVGEISSATLVEFSDPNAVAGNRLYVPGGVPVNFTLGVDHNGNLTLSYTLPPSACHHPQHNDEGICPTCGTPVGHYYENGVCNGCGATDPSYNPYEYYLFGYINGVNYGTEDDYANVGEYKFENGKLTTTFTEDSYVGVKEADPNGKFGLHIMGWYMTDGWQGTDITSVTLYNSDRLTNADKLYVPGGVKLTFTLVRNEDGTLTLSYETVQCNHNYTSSITTKPACVTPGVKTFTCTLCGDSYTENLPALEHSFTGGKCDLCGIADPDYVTSYYLFGSINGANYGCEDDHENLGIYKFVEGKLTVTFEQDSYVGIKTGDNLKWYMTDGWQGEGVTAATLYNSEQLANADKLYIPAGVETTFNLVVDKNDTLKLVISYAESECSHNYTSKVTTAATCDSEGVKTFTCTLCGDSYTSAIAATGHSYKATITTAPTCDKEGVKTFTCTNCNHSYTEKIAATGHNYVSKVTAPTCDKEGFTTYTCSKCGNSYTDSKTPATGHVYNQGTITTTPGCDKDGVKTYTCTKCSNTKTEPVAATGHNYVSKVTAPTCDKEGFTTYTCSRCGNSYTDSKTPATGHVYNQGTITTAPGCGKDGVKTFTCTKCGNTKTETVAATGHNYVSKVTPPTCDKEGYTTYTCTKCGNNYTDSKTPATGHVYNQGSITTTPGCEKEGVKTFTCTKCGNTKTEAVAAIGHNYIDKVTPPTCTAEGFTKHTCSRCGNNYTDSKIAALGHRYNQGTITTSPGCEKDGEKTFTCTGCGDTKTEKIAATGHNYVDKVIPPTCSAEGYTTHTCTKCGNKYTDNKVPAGEHAYNQGAITTSPGCEKEGVKTFTCTICGNTKTETVAATGHNYVDKVTPPTCSTEGYTTHTCTRCGNKYTDSKVPAGNHTYDQGSITTSPSCEKEGVKTFTCNTCGHTKTEAVAATGHNYVTKVTPPTCTAEGFTKHTCSRCGNNYTDNKVAALGHRYNQGSITTSPGCEKEGEKTFTCTGCGDTKTEVIAATGHNYVSKVIAPTCTTEGYTNHTCSKCGNSYTDSKVAALGHRYNQGSITTSPGCEKEGVRTFTCTGCGTTKTEAIAATGHNYVSKVIAPTCTTEGYTNHTCSRCGNTYTDSKVPTVAHKYVNGTCTACGHTQGTAPVVSYYLFGYINGANYACEEDAANLGEYKFVNSKLTVTFMKDSYVGIKTGDNATWYMTDGWLGETTSATLYNNTTLTEPNKLFIPGGSTVVFTLKANADDSLSLSYTVTGTVCVHATHNQSGVCTSCGAAVEHSFAGGICTDCGAKDPNYVASYYLFGYINGANYGCEEDAANLGEYKFVGGKLTVTFLQDSYVGIKTGDNAVWYMTNGWLGNDVTSATLYNSTTLTEANKLFVPGGSKVTFNLTTGAENTLVLSYTVDATVCVHPTHNQSGLCTSCGATVNHSFAGGICSGCNAKDPNYVASYYMFGFINGVNYGCEADHANLGEYKFVDGKLTMSFNEDSYVGIKTGDNAVWYMTNGWLGKDVTTATLYNSTTLTDSNKLFIPGGKTVTFTLKVNNDGSLTLSYTVTGTACTHATHSQSGICSSCGATVKHTFAAGVCTGCGLKDAGYVAEYYLFGFINGANYGYEEDYSTVGIYKFVDGQLTVTFEEDSYVGIKTGDNATWYMTDGWVGSDVTSATLYVSTMLVNANKLFVPGGVSVTFNLKVNADNSLTLSYVADTAEPVTGSISGTITDYGTDNVTVELWTEGATAPSYSTTASNGTYSIKNVEPGTYTLKVSKLNHATRSYTVTIGEKNLDHNVTIYLKGDLTCDGRVNVADSARIYAHVRRANVITDPYILSLGEVTGEGKVNIADVSRIYSHVRGVNYLW